MASSAVVLLERRDQVALITLNDPDTLNALTQTMVESLARALEEAMGTSRAIVIRGAGRGFCAGFNIGPGLDLSDPAFDAGAVLESHLNGLILALRKSPLPIITAVRGVAAGAGASLALAADLVVAGAETYFLQSFTRVGLVPDAGASWFLARAVGRVRAMELTLLGDRLDAAKAMNWGLVNRVVEENEVDDCALALAARLAAGPTRALGRTREAIWAALETPFAEQLAFERQQQREAGRSPEFREGVAAFREKRAPRFT